VDVAVFSNILKKAYIQILADSDEHDLVQQVQVTTLCHSPYKLGQET
jgi:hypothetical protein